MIYAIDITYSIDGFYTVTDTVHRKGSLLHAITELELEYKDRQGSVVRTREITGNL